MSPCMKDVDDWCVFNPFIPTRVFISQMRSNVVKAMISFSVEYLCRNNDNIKGRLIKTRLKYLLAVCST